MPIPNEAQLLDDVAHAHGEAKSLKSLYALYGLKGPERVALRRLVRRLLGTGALVRLRGGQRFGLPRSRKAVVGLFKGTSKGYGFVSPDDPDLPDMLIPEKMLGGAIHGDRVEAARLSDSSADRPAGEILRVVKRGDPRLVGLFVAGDRRRGTRHRLVPFDQRISVDVAIPDRFSHGAEDGTLVEVVLLRDAGDARGAPLEARVVAVLGRPEEPGTDVRVILRSFRLPDAHSPEAVAEGERRAALGIPPEEIARRKDMRALHTVTIDGETARDFDDAISVERHDGFIRVHVHIADVSAFVTEGTALDAEAQERATSVYFPDRALHMLPESLSAGACSLKPDEDRLTMTVSMDVDAQGRVVRSVPCESIIRSDRRMTYTELKRILVDRDDALRKDHAAFLADFELMAEAASALIARREERGGLDFDLPVPIVKVDADGLPTEIVESERNVAHRIIEEFMIAANSEIARTLVEAGEPALHRNHEPPPPDKAAAFREAAAALGHPMKDGDDVETRDFRDVLRAAEGMPEEYFLTLLALRSMSLARYGVEPLGHFGLALTHYAHFTSPIRRYPDLIVHRALKRLLSGQRVSEQDADEITADLAEQGDHCSAAERNAEAAERTLVQWKMALFMRDRVGDEFDARITGLSERGVHVVLLGHHVEGFVRFQALARDYYERDSTGLRLIGERTGRTLRLGDELRVRVVDVDVFRRRIEMEEA